MERVPSPAAGTHWIEPEQQTLDASITQRSDADIPPVFGTAQPPRGLSGMVRRFAYRIPEWRPGHWMMLLLADRVDWVESALGEGVKRVGQTLRRSGREAQEQVAQASRPGAEGTQEKKKEQSDAEPCEESPSGARWDCVDEESWESFPASDPPSHWAGKDRC